jgi:hypothetical protein
MEKILPFDKTARKSKAESLKRGICDLLKWTEMEYAEFVWNCGVDYLNAYLKGDQHAIGILERNRIFWAWWRNHFMNRDENFLLLHRSIPQARLDIRVQLYVHYNDATALAESIHPNSVVLNESYALMMTELVEKETTKQLQS